MDESSGGIGWPAAYQVVGERTSSLYAWGVRAWPGDGFEPVGTLRGAAGESAPCSRDQGLIPSGKMVRLK